MVGRLEQMCHICGSCVGFEESDNGFFYCGYCNSQAEDIVQTGIDDEEFIRRYYGGCKRIVRRVNAILREPNTSKVKLTTSHHFDHPKILANDDMMCHGVGPTEPMDFGSSKKNYSYDDYYSEIRSRYLSGLQYLIQTQCQSLVEHFDVSPTVIKLIGPLWLRFVAFSRVTSDDWADETFDDSEAHTQGKEVLKPRAIYGTEPVNIHGKRAVYVWYRSLKRRIPISCSLAISFLCCHVAREAITPADMIKWTLEGKIPYFAAFHEIEKQIGSHSELCPIPASRMFRPIQAISSQKLESMAANVAMKIRLQLDPVNFNAIASRFLRKLSLSIDKLLPEACNVCLWSTPPELYLSDNDLRIPSRVCVMSILIVTIRILYNIHGYGFWESSWCENEDSGDEDFSSSNLEPSDSGLNVKELLQILEAKYNELDDMQAYSSNLTSYLKYCKDVVFCGLQPSYEDVEEEKLLEELWDFYENNKAAETSSDNPDVDSSGSIGLKNKRRRLSESGPSKESPKDKAIKRLKLDMEDNKFCYMPPRTNIKRNDYLYYARRREDVYIYAVHADYYILLRSCAKVADVDPRTMHNATLDLERRLGSLEK